VLPKRLLMLMSVAVVLACCGQIASAQVTLTLWSGLTMDVHRDYYVNEVLAGFERENPDIKIEVSFKEDLNQALRTAMQAGAGPDIVYTPGPSFALEYVLADMLLPLDHYAELMNWSEKISGWALDLGRVDGKLYSLPKELEAMVLFYNKTLFEEMGWAPPQTLEEMEAIAEAAFEMGIIPFAHGNNDWRPANEWHVGVFLNHYAGPKAVKAALKGEKPWTDEEFVEAIAMLNEYMQRGWFSQGVGNYYSLRGEDRWSMLASGEAAMIIEGSWAMSSAGEYFGPKAGTDTEWDWVPVPVFREGVEAPLYTIGVGSTISINARSPYPDEAAKFIDYLFADRQRAARWIYDQGAIFNNPLPFEPTDFPADMEERWARFVSDLAAAVSGGNYGYTTWTFWPPRSDVYIYEGIESVWSGELSPNDYLANLDAIFREEIADGKIPPIPD